MTKRLILAAALVAFMAIPAFASVQNVKVSGDINNMWLTRDKFDLGLNTGAGSNFGQNLAITQTRLRVDADLTDNVSTTVRLLNERAWNDVVNTTDEIDINLAYVTLKEMLYSPLTVMVGRQDLNYGNAFIVGKGGVNNLISAGGLAGVAQDLSMRTAYDAVRLVLDYHPLTIDVFASKIDSNVSTGAKSPKDDIDLYGLVANYQLGDKWSSMVEGYFFSRIDNSAVGTGVGLKADTVYAPGARVSTNPIKGLNLQGELAWQGGNKAVTGTTAGTPDNFKRNALGAQAIATYAVQSEKVAKWKPVLQGVYTYVSGDHNAADERPSFSATGSNNYTAWDPMFEDQAGGTIYNTLFDLSNAHIAVVSLSLTPMEDVISKLSWTGIWLDRSADFTGAFDKGKGSGAGIFNLRQPDGSTSLTPVVTSNKAVGNEIDADLTYDYTEDVQLGLSGGVFLPGDFFDSANNSSAKQLIAKVNVNF